MRHGRDPLAADSIGYTWKHVLVVMFHRITSWGGDVLLVVHHKGGVVVVAIVSDALSSL